MPNSSPDAIVKFDGNTPPINALPAEVFLDILMQTLDFETTLIPQLHNLAQVCVYWFRSILSNSCFWCVLDLENKDLAPVILRRNPSGPLIVRCRLSDKEDLDKDFIEVAQSQAHRWKVVDLEGYFNSGTVRLLNITTPALVTLRVLTSGSEDLIISPSSPLTLRHIAVRQIQLPWNSAYFHGLRSLSMDGCSPSLPQIVTTLSATPALEWLSIDSISGRCGDDPDVPEQSISLPALRGFYLLGYLHSHIRRHLLRNIDGPQCRILEATIPFTLLQHLGPTFGTLSSIPISAANHAYVYYSGRRMGIQISSSPLPRAGYRNGWRCKSSDPRVSIWVKDVPYADPNAIEYVIDVLPFRLTQADIMIGMYPGEHTAQSLCSCGGGLTIWHSATHIFYPLNYGGANIIADLHYLASPVVKDGRGGWPCPRLVRLKFLGEGGAELVDAILEFLEKRSATRIEGRAPGTESGVVWDTPMPFEVLEANEDIVSLIQGAKVVENVQFVIWKGVR